MIHSYQTKKLVKHRKKLSPLKKNTGLLIRIDDIAAHMKWDLIQKCEILFDELNIRPVLGVIPNNKDEEFLKYKKKDDFWDKVREVWDQKIKSKKIKILSNVNGSSLFLKLFLLANNYRDGDLESIDDIELIIEQHSS